MPSADRLGDPLEGTTPQGELEWWKRAAAEAETEEQRKIIEQNRAFLSRMAARLRGHYFVSCWAMKEHETRAMWNCYTSSPESVAIRTAYAVLRKNLPEYCLLGLIRYIDYAKDRLPSMNLLQHVTHKDVFYDFESEVRAVVMTPPDPDPTSVDFRKHLFEKKDQHGFLVFAPPIDIANLIQGVVLHPDASPEFASRIAKLCMKISLPAPEQSRQRHKPEF